MCKLYLVSITTLPSRIETNKNTHERTQYNDNIM